MHIDLPEWQDNYDNGNQITGLRSKGFKLDTLSIKYYGGYIVIIKTIILDTLTIKYYSRYIVIIKTVVLAAGILTGIIEQESTSRVVKQLYTLVFKRSLKYIMPKH